MLSSRIFTVTLCLMLCGVGFILATDGVKAQRSKRVIRQSKSKAGRLSDLAVKQVPAVERRKSRKGGRKTSSLTLEGLSSTINPNVAPSNDECTGAINIPSNVGYPVLSPVVDITDATVGANEPTLPSCLEFDDTGVARSVWFTFTPQDPGPFVVSTCEGAPTGTTVQDTVLTLYTSDGGCGNFREVPFSSRGVNGCDDNSCDPETNGQAVITTNFTANTTYYIVVREGLNNGYDSIDDTGLGDVQVRIQRTALPARQGNVLISEFRLSANRSTRDEFIELYNNTDEPLRIGGYRVRSFDPVEGLFSFRIPTGTILPARAHYLIADVTTARSYSLEEVAAPDAPIFFGSDFFVDNQGLALVTGGEDEDGDGSPDSPLVEIDKVGFTGADNTSFNFIEGTGLARYTAPVTGEHSFVRRYVGVKPVDTDNNAADFIAVTIGGPSAFSSNVVTVLGAPGPQSTTSPYRGVTNRTQVSLFDTARAANQSPNLNRYLDEVNSVNATQGTLAFRRTLTNTSGAPVNRLRFRLVNLTTLGSPNQVGGAVQADLRALSSPGSGRVTVTRSDGTQVTLTDLTLEAPASDVSGGLGGGVNSTLVAGLPTVLEGGMNIERLAPNESVSVEFLFGVNSPRGSLARYAVIIETVP